MLGSLTKNSIGTIAFAVSVTCAISGMVAGNASAETLTGAVEKVLSGHPKAKAAKAAADIAHYQALEVRGSLLPHLNVGGSFGPSYRDRDVSGLVDSGDWLDESRGNVSVRQRLFQRGLALNDTKAAKSRAETARLMSVEIDQKLTLMVIESYLGILRGQEQVDMARDNVKVHEDTLNKTQTRKDAGRATQADIELVKARLGLARSSVETRKVLLNNAKVRYRALVEEEPENLQPIGSMGTKIPTSSADADITGNPALLAAKENYEAAKYQSIAGKGLLWPLIELDVGGGLGNDVGGVRGQDDEAHAFLVASWDVWEGGARRAQKKQRETREEEALNLALDTQLAVEELLGAAIVDRNGAILTEKQLQDYATAIGEVVGAYEKQVEVGSRAILNLLDVKNESFRSNSALVDAEFASKMAGYRVIAATGRIVEVVAPNAANGGEGVNDANDGGGKNVIPGPDAQWLDEPVAEEEMIVDADVEGAEEVEQPKKKGVFARMFGGKSKKQPIDDYQAYDADASEEAVVGSTSQQGSEASSEKKAYSWSATSSKNSKLEATKVPAYATAPVVTESVVEPAGVEEIVTPEPTPVYAAETVGNADEMPAPKKKGFFSKMFGGKKSRGGEKGYQEYQEYQDSQALNEDAIAAEPVGSTSGLSAAAPAPVVTEEPVEVVEIVEEEVEIEAEAEPAPAPAEKKKRGGIFKFLKPGKSIKSAKPPIEEVRTGEVEVDEVVQSN